MNPKRKNRMIQKEIQSSGIGTKSQQALKIQSVSNKKENRVIQKQRLLALEQKKRILKEQKKKGKHKGR